MQRIVTRENNLKFGRLATYSYAGCSMHVNDSISSYNLPTAELALLSKGKTTNFFFHFLVTSCLSGNFHTIADLLLTSTQDAAKRCKASPVEVKRVFEKVL